MADTAEEKPLLERLTSNKRTLVIQAIVQLAKSAASNDALKALQQIADGTDRELSFFAAQAVSRIRSRRGDAAPPEGPPGDASPHPPARDDAAITRDRLLSPATDEVPCLLTRLRAAPETLPEELRPAVAAFLGRYGRPEDAPLLTAWLDDPQSGLIVPVIEAIEALAPHALTAHFPALLASDHPIVRMRAITALRRIDPDEAEAHLFELLASRRVEERLAGLSSAFLFPFPKVKEYLLEILGEEQDPEVLHACETLLASNPETDTALRLLDLIDMVPKPQAARLSAVFKTVCTSIAAAGLLDAKEPPHECLLKLWRRERLRKFLADLEIQIAVAPAVRREAIEEWLTKNLQTPEVTAFVEKLAQNPATEDIHRRLAAFLPGKAASAPSRADDPPRNRPEPEKLRLLGQLDRHGWEQHAGWVREEARFGSPAVRAAALLAMAAQSSEAADLPLAESALQQDEPDVQLAAFKLLEARAPERLLPRLSELLASSAPKLRGRAIRFALKRDAKAALQGIDWMLRSQDRSLRAQAVSCLFLFPFEDIASLLLRTLETEDHPAIARQLLVILLSNPSKEILEKLDHLQSNASAGVSMLIAQGRMDLFDILLKLGVDVHQEPQPASTEPPRPVSAPGTKAAPPPAAPPASPMPASTAKPYSVAEVRQAIRNREAGVKPSPKADPRPAAAPATGPRIPFTAILAGLIIALAFLPILVMRSAPPASAPDEPRTSGRARSQDERRTEEQVDRLTGIPGSFRMGRPCRLTGVVASVVDKKTFLFEAEGKTFRCSASGALPMLLAGEALTVEMLPYRNLPNGTVAADVSSATPVKGTAP
ncbi:MAG TPA: hypothetical protein PLP29_13715 [Candidatus Ozemobacteraceae bacterium]|mgnify:CR=1 FL=1|nr:hypothetical protein [Candidatus Ozemobacteraceae bacterium]